MLNAARPGADSSSSTTTTTSPPKATLGARPQAALPPPPSEQSNATVNVEQGIQYVSVGPDSDLEEETDPRPVKHK